MKIPQSDGSVFSLRPHQLTSAGEMEHLESHEPHSGILADDRQHSCGGRINNGA